MTKSEFMEKLSLALKAGQGDETVNGMLDDFNEHFDEAIRAGQSEAEICEMLGDPVEIAADYGEETEREAVKEAEKETTENDVPEDDAGINIRLFNVSLCCEPCESEEFYVEIRQNGKIIQDESIQVEQTRNSLRITQQREKDFIGVLFRVFTFSETVFVRIPRRFYGDMFVKMTSGNARFDNLLLKGDFQCELISGNVNMERVRSERALTVCSRSGNISLHNCDGDLTVECSSGNISVKAHKGNVLRASATSGTIRVGAGHIVKDCTVEVKSGSVRIDLDKLESDLRLDCYSGSIKFSVRDLGGNITGRTRSGSITGALDRETRAVFLLQSSTIQNKFPNAVTPENGLPVVNLTARSGMIHLNEL